MRCTPEATAAPELLAHAGAARAFLREHGMWSAALAEPIVLVLGAPVQGALSVRDMDPWLGPDWRGRPGVLFADGDPSPALDPDVVTHELTHVWMRAAGAETPRWELQGERATCEAGALQEGIADFVAVARSGSPICGRSSTPTGMEALSMAVLARCPEDFQGDPHADSLVISSALWSARAQLGPTSTLGALAKVAPGNARRVAEFSMAMDEALTTAGLELGLRWRAIADEHGLQRCEQPLELQPGAAIDARMLDFTIPGLDTFSPVPSRVLVPQEFELRLPSPAPRVRVSLRGPRTAAEMLAVVWQADGRRATAKLVAGAVSYAELDPGPLATAVRFRLASTSPAAVRYAGVRADFAGETSQPPATSRQGASPSFSEEHTAQQGAVEHQQGSAAQSTQAIAVTWWVGVGLACGALPLLSLWGKRWRKRRFALHRGRTSEGQRGL
jgi:hypothetical protein